MALSLAGASCASPAVERWEAVSAPRIQLTPCGLPKSSETVLCGKHAVLENRAVRAGRRITLNLMVLPATGPTRAGDPVFVLVGGPGLGAASQMTGDIARIMEKLRRERDLVFVDQRGTGGSHRLPCPFSDGAAMQNGFNELFPIDRVRACRATLQQSADLRLYTTPIAMDDLDEVRAVLGYDTINVYGVSYGAQAALQYLRQHPARVRSVALAGVATPAAKQPLNFARAAQDALGLLMDDCAADAPCRAAFPDLRSELARLLAAFEHGPIAFTLWNPGTKAAEQVSMSRGVFVERLRLMLYDLGSASQVPRVIHRAVEGDWQPFASASSSGTIAGVSGMYMTITCSETMARITEADVVRESRGTYVGEYRTRSHLRACQEWPRGDVPRAYYAPVRSDVPVLMLSGELDAATPAHLATAAARSLPNSRQLLIRNAAHAYGHPCLQGIVAEFVAKASTRDLDVACVQELRRPPFVVDLG